jgi:nucleoside-diphosphate-sugar epimerase
MDFYSGRLVLVTGGLGFIGSNLVLRLLNSGARVRVMDHSWPGAGSTALDRGTIEFLRADVRDATALQEAVHGCSVLFNLAGRSGSAASNSSPLEDLDINARGHLTILEACRQFAPELKVVFPSSRLVYAPTTQLPVAESAVIGPLSIYGIHKLVGEHYHLLYGRIHGIRSTVLRITNPYGPHQRRDQSRYGIINWFIHRALSGQDLPIYGDGSQLRDYVHVDDVVHALMTAGRSEQADGRIFNVGGGHPVAFKDMAELVIAHTHSGCIRFVEWPQDAASVETGDFVADIGLIERVLGWAPTVGLELGIEDTIRKYGRAHT